ncbi:MAG: hypothetical protein AAFV95_27300 [Bacteroidota bacterium]
MKIPLWPFTALLLFFACQSESPQQEKVGEQLQDSTGLAAEFIAFPIPPLDSIFPYFQTSGVVERSPSNRFYNPSDSGLFVFYTLFDQKRGSGAVSKFQEIGILTTHTYFKPSYGWSETDKDQTFILLHLFGKAIKLGKTIEIGMSMDALTEELGQPLYQRDSSYVFLGKNNFIGQFRFENGTLQSLTYGRYNLPDEIFGLSKTEKRRMVEEKLKGPN